MYSGGWRYFKQATNYFEWILYLSVLYFMFPVRSNKTVRQMGVGSIAIFFSWFNLIWFLRRIPDIGTYILTLQKVFKTLLKVSLRWKLLYSTASNLKIYVSYATMQTF